MCYNDEYQPTYRSSWSYRAWRVVEKHIDKEQIRCKNCNTRRKLQTHHIDFDYTNNHINNIMVLCCDCHQLYHSHTIMRTGRDF